MEHLTLAYEADHVGMRSELFFEPAAGPRAAVLVFPEAFGLGDNARQRARRLASSGYIAMECDLHGDGRSVTDLTEALALVQPLFDDPLRTRARAAAALQALASRPEVDRRALPPSATASPCRLNSRGRAPPSRRRSVSIRS